MNHYSLVISPALRALAILLLTFASSTSAALTQEQIRSLLGDTGDITWTLTGPNPTAWYSAGNSLGLLNVPLGTFHALETTLTGPGVIRIDISAPSPYFRTRIRIDGQTSGPYLRSHATPATTAIPAGTHTIRWEIEKTSSTNGGSATFGKASWQPYQAHPLASALAPGTTLTLTSEGASPWIGQDRLHSGDGAAAWSGLRLSGTDITPAPLRTEVTGPTVVTFKTLRSGDGNATFKAGSRPVRTLTSTTWQNIRTALPAGTHLLEWNAIPWSGAFRETVEMAVDEIQLLPVVPLSEALDSAQINWTTTATFPAGEFPFGIPDSSAVGGSFVVIPSGSSISTSLSGPAMIRFRSDASSSGISLDGKSLSVSRISGQPDDLPRKLHAAFIPPGDSQLLHFSSWADLELDDFQIIPPPANLAAALGTAAEFHNSPAWSVAAMNSAGSFGVGTSLTPENPESWLEIPVTGPAQISIGTDLKSHGMSLEFFANNKLFHQTNTTNFARTHMEIGPGITTLKCRISAKIDPDRPKQCILGALEITPITPPANLLSTTNLISPLVIGGLWKTSPDITHANPLSIQPVPTTPTWNDYQIQTHIDGPGLLTFSWHREKTENGQSASWRFETSLSSRISQTTGWSRQSIWFPAGRHWIAWKVSGGPEQLASAALADVSFTTSTITTVAEALDAPDLSWETNTWSAITAGDHDFALSPTLPSGAPSVLSTTVQGPGELTFHWNQGWPKNAECRFLINGSEIAKLNPYSAPETIAITIHQSGPVRLEWVANHLGGPDDIGWIELDAVSFQAWPQFPLAAALDATPEINWTTGGDSTFSGRSHPFALNGSAAYAAVADGETAWLEASVDGPGLFDFWLLEIPGVPLNPNPWTSWSLEIDGHPVTIGGTSWPAQWITSAGPHRIRLTLLGTGSLTASAVDQVSWIPLEPTSQETIYPSLLWTHGPETAAFTAITRSGSRGFMMRLRPQEPAHLQTTVTGPCLLEWDALSRYPAFGDYPEVRILINETLALPENSANGKRQRLSLPEGEHTIRWQASEPPYPQDPPDPTLSFDAVWILGDFSLTPGVSPIADALDTSEAIILEFGNKLGTRVITQNGGDAWRVGKRSGIRIAVPDSHFAGSLAWGDPLASTTDLYISSQNGGSGYLRGDSPQQQSVRLNFRNNEIYLIDELSQTWQDEIPGPMLDRLDLFPVIAIPLTEATESTTPVSSTTWLGIADPDSSADSEDCAWSFLGLFTPAQIAATQVTGPAEIRFSWKKTGRGALSFRMDDIPIPFPPADDEWREMAVHIPAGTHTLTWHHTQTASNIPNGEAWLDQIQQIESTENSLTQAAILTPGHSFLPVEDNSWHTVSYRHHQTWIDAARSVSGSPTLSLNLAGPASVRFKARCFNDTASPFIYATHGISAYLGDLHQTQIPATTSGDWTTREIHIPAGQHQVIWRLTTTSSFLTPNTYSPSTVTGLDGWLDDVEILTPAQRYAEWSAHLPPGDDPDQDGVPNLLEYAFGTDAADPSSKPPLIFISPEENTNHLMIPYLQPFASAWVESSQDMRSWQNEPGMLLIPEPFADRFNPILAPATTTHQAIPLPHSPHKNFYRIKITLN